MSGEIWYRYVQLLWRCLPFMIFNWFLQITETIESNTYSQPKEEQILRLRASFSNGAQSKMSHWSRAKEHSFLFIMNYVCIAFSPSKLSEDWELGNFFKLTKTPTNEAKNVTEAWRKRGCVMSQQISRQDVHVRRIGAVHIIRLLEKLYHNKGFTILHVSQCSLHQYRM